MVLGGCVDWIVVEYGVYFISWDKMVMLLF